MDIDGTLGNESRRCCMCHRILLSEVGVLEAMSICGDCKFLFLEDTDTRYNNSSSETIENMINLSRHWRRVLTDTESDDFDSVFEEADVSPYADSNPGSYDTDTDSMHGGLHHWNSDYNDNDNDNDDDDDGNRNVHGSLVGRARLRRSLATNGRNLPADWIREVLSAEVGIGISERNGIGNSGEYEYVDGETERGAPPASASFVKSLERVVVNDDEVEGLVCVICKESVCVGSVVNRLPCLHVYHSSCIIPWLNAHNTCPLCRYKLPTDGGSRRPNRNHELVGRSENVGGGSGGGWWWFVVAPLVSVVGIGLMLWLGRGGGRRWWSEIRFRWW